MVQLVIFRAALGDKGLKKVIMDFVVGQKTFYRYKSQECSSRNMQKNILQKSDDCESMLQVVALSDGDRSSSYSRRRNCRRGFWLCQKSYSILRFDDRALGAHSGQQRSVS